MIRIIKTYILASAALITACNNSSQSGKVNTPAEISQETQVDDDAMQFIKQAGTGGIFEQEVSKIAVEHASDPEVKNFASMMVNDHTQANQKIMKLAQEKVVNLSKGLDNAQKTELQNLAKLSGKEFDSKYMARMVNDHEKTVALFEKNGVTLRDPDVNKVAEELLPTLRNHLQSARTIYQKVSSGQQ